MTFGQPQQGPITARNHLGAPLFFDGRKRQIEVEEREDVQRALGLRLLEGRVHACLCSVWRSMRVSIRIRASAALAAASAISRDAPVASTMAPLGRLSPAGAMMSPGLAVITSSAMPGMARAASAPCTAMTVPGPGKA